MKSLKVLLVSFVLLSSILTVSSLAQVAERLEIKQIPEIKQIDEAVIRGPLDRKALENSPEVAASSNYAFATTTSGTFTDMSTGTTTLVAASNDDAASAVTNLPFDFYFMGTRYTQFSASSNGFIRMGGTGIGTTQYALGTAGIPLISALGSDLEASSTGRVHFKVTGAAPNRVLTVEFLNMTIIYDAALNGVDGTCQIRLYETSGVIEFVYGPMARNASTGFGGGNNPQYIGFSINNTTGNQASVDTANTVSTTGVPTANLFPMSAPMASLNSLVDGSRRTYSFTSPVPTSPGPLSFTAITAVSYTINWADSTNERLYAIYRSTDGINFSFFGTAAEDATSFNATGLTPSTNYFWQVFAVSEGALNTTASTGNQMTGAPGNDTCLGAGGNWNTPATWADNSPPTSTDIVTIQSGCTVTIDSSNAFSVIVQSGGVLQFEQTTARTLTVTSDVTIDTGGTFQSNALGTQTGHILSVGGNLTNNGTLDFSTNTNTAGAGITFTGAANNTFGGTGTTTDVRTITINKGTSNVNILELMPTNFTVRGAVTDSATANYLTLTNGTFKISGTFTAAFRTFTVAAYTIPATTGFWLNNSNYTVSGQNGSPVVTGLLRLSTGIYNVGTASGNSMSNGAGAVFTIEGDAVLNCTGRFSPQSAVTYNQSGGTVNVSTIGHTANNFAGFELFSASTVTNLSGGTINIVQANSTGGAIPVDLRINGTMNFTLPGTTVNLGTAATTGGLNMRVSGNVPNLVVDNTTTNKTATFIAQTVIFGNQTINTGTTYNLNGFLVATVGANSTSIVNNGTIAGSMAGSTWYFQNSSPLAVTGTGIQGTNAAPIAALSHDSTGGVNFGGMTNNAILRRINLFTGGTTGSGKLTLGAGDAVVNIIQVGNATTATAAGSFDVPLTFNLGTGGQTIFYLRETGTRTTGNEVNPARTLVGLRYDDNGVGKTLTIAGGNLLATGALELVNGVILTGANILTHNGAATRTLGHVDGTLNRSYTATGVYTYHVGQGGYSPVLANVSALTTNPSQLSVQPFDATLGGFSPAQSISRNWLLTEVGDLTADISLTYLVADENGNEADYRVWRRDGAGLATDLCGAPCVNTGTNVAGPAVGVTAFGRFTAAEALTPTAAAADISGRILTAGGLPISNVRVILSGGQLPEPINVYTGHLGIYYFPDVPVGQNYVITVKSRRFFFAKPSHLFTLNDDLIDQDFVAEPQWPQ